MNFGLATTASTRTGFSKTSIKDISGQLGFPGVPFSPVNGGLPQLTFSDVSTLGSPTFLPSAELQNTYVLDENLTLVRGRHTLKFGTELRKEEFTILQPAESRGTLNFGNDFTANPGAQDAQDASGNALGSGSGFASFLLGATDGGGINNINNVDYHRPIYSFFAQDDWRVSDRLTLNLGLRYELFTTVKERNNQQATLDSGHGDLDRAERSERATDADAGLHHSDLGNGNTGFDQAGPEQLRTSYRAGLHGQ